MRQVLPTRSDEPVYWLMFGAGGMVAAIVLPVLLLLMIAAGIWSDGLTGLLGFEHIRGLFGNWLLSLMLFGIIFLLCFYSLHRMYHSTHDFGFHTKLFWFAAYGGAAALSFITFGLQFLIYCKLW